jgi:EAL domain-containing protein (putative c-di-GMP-specific phosphodiesterase class I)
LKIRPNYIKIDGSLIKNIYNDKNSYEMVKSIIDFSKALNIKVIAEFVHSKDVYNTLFDLGVDEFQGFYLGEPSLKIE